MLGCALASVFVALHCGSSFRTLSVESSGTHSDDGFSQHAAGDRVKSFAAQDLQHFDTAYLHAHDGVRERNRTTLRNTRTILANLQSGRGSTGSSVKLEDPEAIVVM